MTSGDRRSRAEGDLRGAAPAVAGGAGVLVGAAFVVAIVISDELAPGHRPQSSTTGC